MRNAVAWLESELAAEREARRTTEARAEASRQKALEVKETRLAAEGMVMELSTQNFRPVPRTHAASQKGLLDGAVDLPSFSAGVVDPTHSSRDVPVNLTL